MKVPAFIPGPAVIARETLTVLAGAILAAAIVSQLPGVKAWMKRAWA